MTATQTGHLRPNEWTTIVNGWGFYHVTYSVQATAQGVEYRNLTTGVARQLGTLIDGAPTVLENWVVFQGSIILRSPVSCQYHLSAVSKDNAPLPADPTVPRSRP